MKVNTLINYLTLLLVVVLAIFMVLIFRKLADNQNQINNTVQTVDNHVDCIAGYFTMQHRTGDTTLNCK